jgi:hypothetical protein
MARKEHKDTEKKEETFIPFSEWKGDIYKILGYQEYIDPKLIGKQEWKPARTPHIVEHEYVSTMLKIKSKIEEKATPSFNNIVQGIRNKLLDLDKKPSIYTTTIFDIEGMKMQLPIPVVIEAYPDEYVARFSEVEAYGVGVTESDAIHELKVAIADLYNELVSVNEDELGPLPLSWLRVLRHIILEKQ